jgi:hypothetical protein
MTSRIAILLIGLGFAHAVHAACNQIFVYLEHAVRGDEIKASFVLHQSKVEDVSLELMYIADENKCSIKSRLALKDSPEIRDYLGWELE